MKNQFTKLSLLLCILVGCVFTIQAQSPITDDNKVYTIPEETAMPVGGMKAFHAYIKDNLKYPEQAKKAGIEGKVYLTFIIEKKGNLSTARVIRGIGAGCDEEAVRLIKEAPKWRYAKQRGKAVRQRMTFTINFKLENTEKSPLPIEEDVIIIPSFDSEYDPDHLYTIVEKSAEPVGGYKAFYAYVKANINYPEQALKTGVEGKVFLVFIVEKDGSRSNIQIIRGIGSGCDEEAIRLVKEGPQWTPAKEQGKVVRQKMTFPINFKLQDAKKAATDTQIEEETPTQIFTIVEESAAPVGGMKAFYTYIRANLQYPKLAKDTGIEGRVYLTFIVEPDGSLSNVRVVRGIGAGCDEEAVRLIKGSPKWKPAKEKGKAIRQKMTFPINFKLR